jgi:putative ABC transport system permease protein
MLAHDVWRARFGSDPAVVGSVIDVDGVGHEVVGVMAPGVHLPREQVGVWLPLRLDPGRPPENDHWVGVIGRLRPGVSAAEAQIELARLTRRFPELIPGAYSEKFMSDFGFATHVVPLRAHVIGTTGGLLWTLFGAAALVLLIALANVANLFLVRAEARRRELAIRSALGGGRGQLVLQSISESMLMALIAAATGLILARAGIALLTAVAPLGIPRFTEIGIGWSAVGFAALTGVVAGIVLGVLPMLWLRIDTELLRGHGHTGARGRNLLRRALVSGQIGLAIVLLAAAGLMLRSGQQLHKVAPGFHTAGVLTFQVALPEGRYGEGGAHAHFYRDLAERIEGLPGVTRTGGVTRLPMQPSDGCFLIYLEDRPHPGDAQAPCVLLVGASPGHLESLGIAVQGALPAWSDIGRGSAGVIITRALAERFWPGEDPIGKGVRGYRWGDAPVYRVAGVIGELRAEGLDRPPTEALYMPLIGIPGTTHWGPYWGVERELYMTVGTTTRSPESLVPAIRAILADLDPALPLARVATMEDIVARSDTVARASLLLLLLGAAAAIAVVLSAIGLYAVISWIIGQRSHEMGVRMALGARAGQIRASVLRESLALAGVGITIGLAATFAAGRVLRSQLFEISATDPLTLGAVTLLLVGIALAAAWLPARRATRIDPVRVLR